LCVVVSGHVLSTVLHRFRDVKDKLAYDG